MNNIKTMGLSLPFTANSESFLSFYSLTGPCFTQFLNDRPFPRRQLHEEQQLPVPPNNSTSDSGTILPPSQIATDGRKFVNDILSFGANSRIRELEQELKRTESERASLERELTKYERRLRLLHVMSHELGFLFLHPSHRHISASSSID